jgi:hypothetical protein
MGLLGVANTAVGVSPETFLLLLLLVLLLPAPCNELSHSLTATFWVVDLPGTMLASVIHLWATVRGISVPVTKSLSLWYYYCCYYCMQAFVFCSCA